MSSTSESSTEYDEPTEEHKKAAWLVVQGKGATLSPPKPIPEPKPGARTSKKAKPPKYIYPKIPDSETLRLQKAKDKEPSVIVKPRLPNCGPNPTGKLGKNRILGVKKASLTRPFEQALDLSATACWISRTLLSSFGHLTVIVMSLP